MTSAKITSQFNLKTHLEPEAKPKIQRVPYIQYSIQFDQELLKVFINPGNEINVMQPNFAKRLSLWIRKINVDPQKINSSRLETFVIAIATFQVENKAERF